MFFVPHLNEYEFSNKVVQQLYALDPSVVGASFKFWLSVCRDSGKHYLFYVRSNWDFLLYQLPGQKTRRKARLYRTSPSYVAQEILIIMNRSGAT